MVYPFLFYYGSRALEKSMNTMMENIAVVILAAGKGTRMKSEKAKVLHEIHGVPMIHYVVESASHIAGNHVIVVVGHQREEVKKAVLQSFSASFAIQEEQKGTGHAVLCALPQIESTISHVVILCGDVPLISSDTLKKLVAKHRSGNAVVTVLAVSVENPKGYGRMIVNEDGSVVRIVEEADASEEERMIRLVNSGIYCVEKEFLFHALSEIKSDNVQNELYLTDIVGIASHEKKEVGLFEGISPHEVTGVNTIDDLELVKDLLKAESP